MSNCWEDIHAKWHELNSSWEKSEFSKRLSVNYIKVFTNIKIYTNFGLYLCLVYNWLSHGKFSHICQFQRKITTNDDNSNLFKINRSLCWVLNKAQIRYCTGNLLNFDEWAIKLLVENL